MSMSDPAFNALRTDWEAAVKADVGGGELLAGGAYLFSFRNGLYHGEDLPTTAYSPESAVWDFSFAGGGFGAGFDSASEVRNALRSLIGKLFDLTKGEYVKLPAFRPFSPADLNGSTGSVRTITAIAWNRMTITATSGIGQLFMHNIGGWGLNAGVDAMAIGGVWTYLF